MDAGAATLLLIFCIIIIPAYAWWGATSLHASKNHRNFAEFLIMTSWPMALALAFKRGADEIIDHKKKQRAAAEKDAAE